MIAVFRRTCCFRIAITPAAFDAIAATLPLGSVGYEADRDAQGNCINWLDERTVSKLGALHTKAFPAHAKWKIV